MKQENVKKLEKMLQPIRFRPSSVKKHDTDGRTPFDSDFARVALSAPVRRLQDKTQVFPLADYDFVRNRLTHSLEVMTIARGLGLGVEKILADNKTFDLINRNDDLRNAISKILEVAALVHDVGNPAFGHKGETAIQNYFKEKDSFIGRVLQKFPLNDVELADLQHIEGNVQGFRILRHLALADDDNSYNLTMPVLATIIKYPFSSTDGNKKIENEPFKKKFGFLEAETQSYIDICNTLGLIYGRRHPLTFLLEAADDITYRACDLEDGFKEGVITIKTIKETIKSEIVQGNQAIMSLVDRLSDDNDQLSNELLMQKLRITIQSQMIIACTEEFVNNIDGIIEGTYQKPILENTIFNGLLEALKKLDNYNFASEQVQGKENEGIYKMLFLLDGLVRAMVLLNEKTDKLDPEYQLYMKISPNYRKAACRKEKSIPETMYEKLLLVTDYIYGMTDGFVHTVYEDEKVSELILRVKCKIDNQNLYNII